jgi:hypothetical protein
VVFPDNLFDYCVWNDEFPLIINDSEDIVVFVHVVRLVKLFFGARDWVILIDSSPFPA